VAVPDFRIVSILLTGKTEDEDEDETGSIRGVGRALGRD